MSFTAIRHVTTTPLRPAHLSLSVSVTVNLTDVWIDMLELKTTRKDAVAHAMCQECGSSRRKDEENCC